MGMGRHDRIDITGAEEHPCPQNAPYEEINNTCAGITGGHKVCLLVCRPEGVGRAGSRDTFDKGQEHIEDKYHEGSCLKNSSAFCHGMALRWVIGGEQKENDYTYDPQIGRARVGKECRSRWSPYH